MKRDSSRVNQTWYATRPVEPVEVEETPVCPEPVASVPAVVPATSPLGSAVGTGPADSAPLPTPQLEAMTPRRAARMTARVVMRYFMASPWWVRPAWSTSCATGPLPTGNDQVTLFAVERAVDGIRVEAVVVPLPAVVRVRTGPA